MVEQHILDILLKKIRNSEINPLTGQPFKIEDVKIEEYKVSVQNIFTNTSPPLRW